MRSAKLGKQGMRCDFAICFNCFFSYSSAGKSESSQSASTGVSSSVGASATAGALSEGTGTQKTPPPGLSENGVKRVLGENPPGVDDLEKVGLTFIRFDRNV